MALSLHRDWRPHPAIGLLVAAAALLPAASAAAQETLLTSGITVPAGFYGASESGMVSDSAESSPTSTDGRYVAFASRDDELAPGLPPDSTSVLRKDRQTGAVTLISRSTGADGAPALRLPTLIRISGDGNLIAWATDAPLDPADVDADYDVYVRNVAAATTTLATPGPGVEVGEFDLASDGTHIAFATIAPLVGGDVNGLTDIYRRDLGSGTVALASRITVAESPVNASSGSPAISDDGRWVAFATGATNVVAGFVNGSGSTDVYARDMSSNANYLVSSRFSSPVTGGNGRSYLPLIAGKPAALGQVRIAYASDATDLADNAVTDSSSSDTAYLRQNLSAATPASTVISRATGVAGANANSRAHVGAISDDGSRVAFSSDASNLGAGDDYYGVYLRDVGASTTSLLSARNEYAVQPALSGNGSFATWPEQGDADGATLDFTSVFGRVVPGGAIELISRQPGNAPQTAAATMVGSPEAGGRAISSDGRYVVFSAAGAGLGVGTGVQMREAVYRRDLTTGVTELVSRATGADGAIAAQSSRDPVISADGSRVAFFSIAQLDPADVDTTGDAYVRDLLANTTTLASRANGPGGAAADATIEDLDISADGAKVAFATEATNLGSPNAARHVYIRDLAAQTTTIGDVSGGGVVGNDAGSEPSLSADGNKLAFSSRSNNFSLDDPVGNGFDIYVRDFVTGTTTLVSRRTGLAGVKLDSSSVSSVISADGSTVAFLADDELGATEAGPWGGGRHLIVRNLATGANTLVSRGPGGGAPADQSASNASISADGNVISFESQATNLLPDRGGLNRDAVFARTISSGALAGPPAFGLLDNAPTNGAYLPSISGDGRCMAFIASGHNAATGKAGDFTSAYRFTVSGTCPGLLITARPGLTPAPPAGPAVVPLPSLTKVSVSNARFKISKKQTALKAAAAQKKKPKTKTGTSFRFTLNTASTVEITIERRVNGRRVGKRCLSATKKRASRKVCKRYVKVGALTRAGLRAGSQQVAFTGRLGKKRLASGSYRAGFIATNAAGKSKVVHRTFAVVRR